MNTKTPKHTALSLLVAMVSVPYVLADDMTGTLGGDENAIDVYVLDCPLDTNNARARVWDRTNEIPANTDAQLQVQVIHIDAGATPLVTDNNPAGDEGEGGGPSPWTNRLGAGNTDYDVHVEKTADEEENYRVRALCYDRNDVELDGEKLDLAPGEDG